MIKTTNITTPNCSTLVLRLALNAIARACAKERGLPRRALVSSQDKSCSVALLGLAFTMAEILLSLTIIGVVAAITLPSLMANINERTWNTQRKALYARMSQAIAMMPQLNGYGTLTEDGSGSVTADTAAETFLTEGLSKVLKINNICDSEHLADCGLPAQVTALDGTLAYSVFPATLLQLNQSFNYSFSSGNWSGFAYSQIDTKAAAFETQNGESVAIFYNPQCQPAEIDVYGYYTQPKMCANFIYDLNGNKGPNTAGKDIGFITALYPTESVVVAPMPLPTSPGRAVKNEASKACTAFDADSRVPNNEELMSVFYNKKLVTPAGSVFFDTWSNSAYTLSWTPGAVSVHLVTGKLNGRNKESSDVVMCVKR